MFVPMVFYDSACQSPAEILSRCPVLQSCGDSAAFASELRRCDLAILQVTGAIRQECLQLLLAQRKSFALLELDDICLNNRQNLAQQVQKRRCRACWLNSLRGFSAVAKLQEVLSSGCLGSVTDWRWQGGKWAKYQVYDLLAWLNAPVELHPLTDDKPTTEGILQLHTTLGQAKITLATTGCSKLQYKIQEFPQKCLTFSNDPLKAELETLLILAQSADSWPILPKL